MNKVLHASDSMNWRTPPSVFDAIERLSSNPFSIDAAAQKGHELAPIGYGPGQPRGNAFDPEPWGVPGVDRVWLNPPYGIALRGFVARACQEALAGLSVWMLVPARTDTKWWHIAMMHADRVYFMAGRVRFYREDGSPGDSAPFPTAVISLSKPHPCRQVPNPLVRFGWRAA